MVNKNFGIIVLDSSLEIYNLGVFLSLVANLDYWFGGTFLKYKIVPRAKVSKFSQY